jgi:RNA polymerase sigma-70 factor (ECF subfamily)
MERVSDIALEFNRSLVQQLTETPQTNAEHLAIAHSALRRVMEEELTPRQREVLVLRYFEQLRLREIAERLDLDISTVCRTLHRAEKRIYKGLRFYFDYRRMQLDEE